MANSLRGEIEIPGAVAPAFRGQADAMAPALQSRAEARFGKGEAVVWRNIEEVNPLIDRQVDGACSFGGISLSETFPRGEAPNPRMETSRSVFPSFR
jgi:hypothetical protein